jgi:hypothetical protein
MLGILLLSYLSSQGKRWIPCKRYDCNQRP